MRLRLEGKRMQTERSEKSPEDRCERFFILVNGCGRPARPRVSRGGGCRHIERQLDRSLRIHTPSIAPRRSHRSRNHKRTAY